MAQTETRKIAETYVKTQLRSWNGRSAKLTRKEVDRAIQKVDKALAETRKASAKAAGR